jgi:putative zinc finger protein
MSFPKKFFHAPSEEHLHHPNTELLSAYLDGEVALVEARAIESHLATCDACRGRLRGLRGVVHQLSALERPAPPPWLMAQVRREVLYAPKESVWMRLSRAFLQLPLAPVASALSVALSGSFVLLLFSFIGGGPGSQALSNLATYPGPVEAAVQPDPDFVIIETTSEVAGRKFVRQEDDGVWNAFLYDTVGPSGPAVTEGGVRNVWVEQGLPDRTPRARVDARSPEGRALLARYSELGDLLADGSRVLMRYQRETLELHGGGV